MPTTDERILRGERVTLRAARGGDARALLEVVREPAVAAWWGPVDLADVAEMLPGSWVIDVEGALAGWVLVHEENDPEFRHASLDIALTSTLQGRGLGPEALRLVLGDLIARGHHRFTIDPAAANRRAIRAYASVGFREVGVLRRYEADTDTGEWRDGLLMELLAEELT